MVHQSESSSAKTEDFSLFVGGPVYQLLLRLGLIKPPLDRVGLRILIISTLVWVPLLVLTILNGRFLNGVKVPFLFDYEVHLRLLASLPLLILAEVVIQCRVKVIVVLVNFDRVDRLEVVAHRSIAFWAHIHCPDRLTGGLVSEPCCAPVGDSRVAPPNWSSATLCQAAETEASGSTPLGLALYRVAGLEIRGIHHEGVHSSRMASQGIPLVLDVEDPAWEAGAAGGSERRAGTDSHHEPGQSPLGRSTDLRRTAEARHRDR